VFAKFAGISLSSVPTELFAGRRTPPPDVADNEASPIVIVSPEKKASFT
jgi:hypothetical protein